MNLNELSQLNLFDTSKFATNYMPTCYNNYNRLELDIEN